jgi:hypothetical protein
VARETGSGNLVRTPKVPPAPAGMWRKGPHNPGAIEVSDEEPAVPMQDRRAASRLAFVVEVPNMVMTGHSPPGGD